MLRTGPKFACLSLFPLLLVGAPSVASSGGVDPKAVFRNYDPEGRLPNTEVETIGTLRVRKSVFSIYYLNFNNAVSLHDQQRIAVIRNGKTFIGAIECTNAEAGNITLARGRLTTRALGYITVIRFNESGPIRKSNWCADGSHFYRSI